MSELPIGWAQATLADVTTPRGEKADPATLGDLPFLGMDHIEAHTAKLLGSQPASELKSAVAIFKKGDILYGRLRPYLNKVHFAKFDGSASAEFIVFPPSEAIEQRFLQCLLQSPEYRTLADQRSTGDRPRVKFDNVSDFEFALPPLPEQRRIVRKLEALSARTTTARTQVAAITKLVDRMRDAILSKALNGTLVHQQEGVGVPAELGEFLTGIEQGWSPPCDNEPKQKADQWAVLTTTALQRVKFSSEENKRLPTSVKPRPNLEVRENDVLMTRKGPRVRCGVCSYVAQTQPRCMFPDTVYRLGLDEGIDPEFFVYLMNSPELLREIDKIKSGGNESGLNLTHGRLKALSIKLWKIDVQRDVVVEIKKKFAEIDRLAVEAEKALKLTDRLDQGILAKAFAGELVPQDPNDEPASALLERIREARANAPKKPRKKPTKAKSMKVAPQERVLTDSAEWPEKGLPFEDIVKRLTLPHDDLKDAVFALLEGDAPKLRQQFDTDAKVMKLVRVTS